MALISRRRRSFALVTGITASAILLSACTSMSSAEPENTQRHVKQIDVAAGDLPSGFADSSIVDPEWETTPQYAEGVFVGAKLHDEELEFTATDENGADRKSTRLNSSHVAISYAVFCLKKKKKQKKRNRV